MDALTRIISAIAPGWAASRVIALSRLAMAKRYYEAAQSSTRRPRRGNNASADAVMDRARGRLREYGRWLDENHDLAVGVLDDLVTNTVGTGAGVEPMAKFSNGDAATDLNRQISELWAEFWEYPEITGELPGTEVERLTCRSWLRDGEVFGQHVTTNLAPFRSRVPYALEMLESDYVPYDMIDANRRVVHGVEKDGWGRPLAYWVYRNHPGSTIPYTSSSDVIRKPADKVMHIKFVRRFGQTRGASIFHSVLTRLDDIKDYEESERIAARVAAAFTAYVKRDGALADAYSTLSTGEDPETSVRNFTMEPGLIFDGLLPGEDVGVIDSKRPNPNVDSFRSTMMRAVAAGTGTRFSSIAKNYNGTYSAQRQELVEARAHYLRLFSYLRIKFYLPVWRNFINASRLAGLLNVPGNVVPMSLYQPEIRPPMMPWIDPKKEIEAYAMMTEYGFRARPQVIRDLGDDPAKVDALLKADTLDVRPKVSAGSTSQDTQDQAA